MSNDDDKNSLRPVSFIIPAHNESKYLPATLSALKQAAENLGIEFEIIVVNDGSTDNTKEIAVAAGAITCDVNLRNIGAVRNAGAKQAANPWLIFIDADTLLPRDTLQETLFALSRGDAGGGAFVEISQNQKISFLKTLMYLSVVLVWQHMGGWAAGCYMFCQKSKFDDFGGFDEAYFAAEELFFSRALKARGRFTLVRHPVITSARKLHSYSSLQLLRFLLKPLFSGRNAFRSRVGLEVLYDDKR